MNLRLVDRCGGASEAVASFRELGTLERLVAPLGRAEWRVDLVLVEDSAMADLNRSFRDVPEVTDVLSFSQLEGEVVPGGNELLGDIVISLDTAIRQAGELGHSVEDEMRRLLVHGVFHLLGYDHERGEEEAALMRVEEEKYL